jgi:hypothetical protein
VEKIVGADDLLHRERRQRDDEMIVTALPQLFAGVRY